MADLNVSFLSNGHGEDNIGASLALVFRQICPDAKLFAFPTVNEGKAYEGRVLDILGPREYMPSSGLLMHNWELFKADIKAGFIPMTLKQIRSLANLRTDVLIVVGDAFALLLSSLVKTRYRFYVQTLVSVHHSQTKAPRPNRFFMEHLSYPERALIRHLVHQTYVRDELTARSLQRSGLKQVSFLGNPMLDELSGQALDIQPPILGLLPGTRAYSLAALELMLLALDHLENVTALVAWAFETEIPEFSGWQAAQVRQEKGLLKSLERGSNRVEFFKGRFADILHTADLVIGTSGTANEQAAALGKPVLAFPVPPIYSQAFLDNQKRLLAEALTLVPAEASAIAETVTTLLGDEMLYQMASARGQQRMGKAGGSEAIIKDILQRIA